MLNLLFDLDGTLTDPKEGIVKSINFALGKFGLPEREASFLQRFIGPRLNEIFRILLETEDAETLAQAVVWFRERYFTEGYQENYVYEGIPELLLACRQSGRRLFIATSKRQDIAQSVLVHFELAPFFTAVYGGDIHLSKTELLRRILQERDLQPSDCLMIGDRGLDVDAGRANNMSTAGVLWGYGTLDELQAAAPDHLAHTPAELLSAIRTNV